MSEAKKPTEETVNVKVSELSAAMEKALQKGIENGMAMAAMAMQQGQQKQAEPAAKKAPLVMVKDHDGKERAAIPGEQCQICKQVLTGCLGEHTMMAVYPKNRRHGKYFQGLRTNGVLYLSNSQQHRIPVPTNAVGDMLYRLQAFEINEDETMNGRTFDHDSGVLGQGGSFNPATGAWR